MTDVIEKLREADRHTTPPYPFDFDAALHAGQARARRRRLIQIGTVAAVPVIVAVGIAVWRGSGSLPAPAPPAHEGETDLPDVLEREFVEPDEAFAVFNEPQTDDDRLPPEVITEWEVMASTVRKLATYDGIDFFVAQEPYDGELDVDVDNKVCLFGVPRSDSHSFVSGCTIATLPVDPQVNLGPSLWVSWGYDTYGLWLDSDVKPPTSEHAGWMFITPNLVMRNSDYEPRPSWGEQLDEAAQYYSVFAEPQRPEDVLPDLLADEDRPWSSRMIGEYEGQRFWLGLRGERSICLMRYPPGSQNLGVACTEPQDGHDHSEPGRGMGIGDGLRARPVPDKYVPSDEEREAWTYIGPNLVINNDPR